MKAIVASITPFKANGLIDLDSLWLHCSSLLDQGADDILLQGTTGEATSLSLDERLKIIAAIQDSPIDPERILMGVGLPSVGDSCALAKTALEVGIRRLLVLPPFFYKKISDDGLFNYIDHLINEINNDEASFYLYHIPQLSGVEYTISLIEKLRSNFGSRIAGVKDSTGNWDNTKSLIEAFPEMNIFAGNERLALKCKNLNGAGCISAGANISIGLLRQLIDSKDSDVEESLQNRLSDIRTQIERSMPISVIKGLLFDINKSLRPPLLEVESHLLNDIEERIKSLNF